MEKRGTGLTFNVIIVAVIALVILIVMLAIYTGFIGKARKDIDKPAEAAGREASDAAWCMSELIRGGKCEEIDAASCTGCETAVAKEVDGRCQLSCPDGYPRHAIAKKSDDRGFKCKPDGTEDDAAARYCCCS